MIDLKLIKDLIPWYFHLVITPLQHSLRYQNSIMSYIFSAAAYVHNLAWYIQMF